MEVIMVRRYKKIVALSFLMLMGSASMVQASWYSLPSRSPLVYCDSSLVVPSYQKIFYTALGFSTVAAVGLYWLYQRMRKPSNVVKASGFVSAPKGEQSASASNDSAKIKNVKAARTSKTKTTTLRKQIAGLKKQISTLTASFAAEKGEKEAALDALKKLEDEKKALEEQLKEAQTDLDEDLDAMEDIHSGAPTLVAGLEASAPQTVDASTQTKNYSVSERADLTKQLTDLEEELTNSFIRASHMRDNLMLALEESQEKEVALHAQIAGDRKTSQMVHTAIAEKLQTLETLEAELQAIKAERDELKSDLERARKKTGRRTLVAAQLHQVNKNKPTINNPEQEATKVAIAEYKAIIAELRAEKDRLVQALDTVAVESGRVRAEIERRTPQPADKDKRRRDRQARLAAVLENDSSAPASDR
jgi:septal ring factor EnvC (AmiA/AmiB activator)